MKSNKPNRRGASSSSATWAGPVVAAVGALFGASTAFAVAPPANTLIGNQAVAAYIDSGGASQTASSNPVQTQVQQVGSFAMTAGVTKSAAGGNTVYVAHTLTNTGNGPDSFTLNVADSTGAYDFTKIEIFLDANGDGLPDSTSALCTGSTTCAMPAQLVPGSGGKFQFVVAYTVPNGMANLANNTATVTGAPVGIPPNALGYASGNQSITITDSVNVTTLAAFSATTALVTPTVAAPGGGAWPVANQSGQRSSAACASPTFATMNPANCDYTVYTINYKNTGAAAGAFYMQDSLPNGFTYVAGSAVWGNAGGVAMGDGTSGDPSGIDFTVIGTQISARVASVGPNVAGTITFMVLVNNSATVGTGLTTNTASYDPVDSTHTVAIPGTAGTVSTNPVSFTVTGSYGVVLGSATSTATNAVDAPAGTPNASAADLNTAASMASGSKVKFVQQVFNTGNAADTFNLSVSSNTFPANTVFAYFAADGITPLLDTNGDGKIDTGSIAAGGTRTVVVVAGIQNSVLATTTPLSMVVLATSVGDPTQFDASKDTVTVVTGIPLDVTGTPTGTGGDVGPGPTASPTDPKTTPAGTGVIFPLFIKNNDPTTAMPFTIQTSQTPTFPGSLPTGWTVKYVAAGAGCAGAALPQSAMTVAPGTQAQVDACVTPPLDATPATTSNVYFKVTSTAALPDGTFPSDIVTDSVTVTAPLTYTATLMKNGTDTVGVGSTVVYAHTLNTSGGQSCGTYTLNAVQPGSVRGWSYALFLDVNGSGTIDPSDTPIVAGSTVVPALLLNAPQKILVRVFSPGGSTPGQNDTVTVTATFAAANGGTCPAVSVTDVSTVSLGTVRAVKTQALDANCDGTPDTAFGALVISAKPGQCVVYRVIATNEGTSAVTNLSINDGVPIFTTLSPVQPAAPCVPSTGITNVLPVYAIGGGGTVSCGSVGNTMAVGATLQLTYAVQLNQ